MRRILAILILLFALAFMANRAFAQGEQPPTADQVNRIAKNLYCPVCENVPLDVCPTAACVQWRQLIADKLAAGWSDQQIYDYFAAQYGDRVLASPPVHGLNWLIYLGPPLALLSGVTVLGQVLRRAKGQTRTAAQPVVPLNSDDEKRIEEELQKRR